MQGLGFAFAIAPLVSAEGEPGHPEASALLARHLQRFTTHPYLAAPIIGSVGRLEAENRFSESTDLKNALMGPYAAIGDSFFWGALRPFAGIAAVCLAIMGFFLAPLLFLVLYNPAHLWVRLRGFVAGWRQGQDAIEFIRRLDLPEMSRRIRWCSTVLLAAAAYLAVAAGPFHDLFQPGLPGQIGGLLVILASFLAVRKGVSPLAILYGSVTFFTVVMMR
jgi:PTS system mannose-specific IID component